MGFEFCSVGFRAHGHFEQFEGSSAEDVANHGIGRQVKPSFPTTPGSFCLC